MIPEHDTRIATLRSGEMQSVYDNKAIQPLACKELEKKGFHISSKLSANIHYLQVNNGKFPFNDVRMKQAISLAVDRETLLNQVYGGYGKLSNNVLSPFSQFHYDTMVTRDVKKAKELAADVLKGKTVDISLITVEQYSVDAQLIAENLKEIGLNIHIEIMDYPSQKERRKSGQYDMVISFRGMDNANPETMLYSFMGKNGKDNLNYGLNFFDDEISELLDILNKTYEEEKRNELYKKIQILSSEKLPIITLFGVDTTVASSPDIEGYEAKWTGVTLFDTHWKKMIKFILKRLLAVIPVFLGITVLAFSLTVIMPGDPAEIVLTAGGAYQPTEEQIAIKRKEMGIDDPLVVQYIGWIGNAIIGNFGISLQTGMPVTQELLVRIPRTFSLAGLSIIFSICLGIPFGVIMATKKYGFLDETGSFFAILFISLPSFWLSILLIGIFSEYLRLLPTSGFGTWQHLILPVTVLSLGSIGSIARLTRSEILNQIGREYIFSARSKGISELKVFFVHALKNALLPVIALIGNNFSAILGGSVIIENIFAINGIGQYVVTAISFRDFPAISGYTAITGTIYVFVHLIVDMLSYYVNPKLR